MNSFVLSGAAPTKIVALMKTKPSHTPHPGTSALEREIRRFPKLSHADYGERLTPQFNAALVLAGIQ